jgi:hypothetical protein
VLDRVPDTQTVVEGGYLEIHIRATYPPDSNSIILDTNPWLPNFWGLRNALFVDSTGGHGCCFIHPDYFEAGAYGITFIAAVFNGTVWLVDSEHVTIIVWALGDANADGSANVGDVVYLINHIFKSGLPLKLVAAGDCNADCSLNIGDIIYLINYIFKGGPPLKVGCATAQRQAMSPPSKTNN